MSARLRCESDTREMYLVALRFGGCRRGRGDPPKLLKWFEGACPHRQTARAKLATDTAGAMVIEAMAAALAMAGAMDEVAVAMTMAAQVAGVVVAAAVAREMEAMVVAIGMARVRVRARDPVPMLASWWWL